LAETFERLETQSRQMLRNSKEAWPPGWMFGHQTGTKGRGRGGKNPTLDDEGA